MWNRLIIVSAACLLFLVGCNKEETVEPEHQDEVIVGEEEGDKEA